MDTKDTLASKVGVHKISKKAQQAITASERRNSLSPLRYSENLFYPERENCYMEKLSDAAMDSMFTGNEDYNSFIHHKTKLAVYNDRHDGYVAYFQTQGDAFKGIRVSCAHPAQIKTVGLFFREHTEDYGEDDDDSDDVQPEYELVKRIDVPMSSYIQFFDFPLFLPQGCTWGVVIQMKSCFKEEVPIQLEFLSMATHQ